MAYAHPGPPALDYAPVTYGASKLRCRGPAREPSPPYALFFGGTETFGKFVPRPYPALVEATTGLGAINLGCVNAGVDVYLREPELLSYSVDAEVAVLQVPGAHTLSNRYYHVHPRRNDRFVKPTSLLRRLYKGLELSDVTFTRHLLIRMREFAPMAFGGIVEELQETWVERMGLLIDQIACDVVLLWIDEAPPPEELPSHGDLRTGPLFVDSGMIARLTPRIASYVQAVPSAEARAAGTRGMVYSEMEAAAARRIPGPMAHEEIAHALLPALRRYAQVA